MKKKTLACLLCSLLVCALVLVGCGAGSGSADEEAISKDLATQLDAFKSSSSEKLADSLKANADVFTTLGITSDDFTKTLMDGFTYNIDSVTVDSKAGNATAKVSVTTKTVAGALKALANNIPTAVGKLTVDDLSSEAKLYNFLGKQLLEAAKSADTETAELTFTYSKTSSGWSMDGLEAQIYKALGLDKINLDSICKELGVGSAAELQVFVNQYLSK